jgi:hypothetical protein
MRAKPSVAGSWHAALAAITALALCLGTAPAWAIVLDSPPVITQVHTGNIEHCDTAVATGEFDESFECGDELFETVFNILDGVGANVGDGGRFTRVPRADLAGTGQWKSHTPARVTGPNAEACSDCHRQPADDGAGPAETNVIRDPQRGAVVGKFIQRNTPHLFAPGAVQVVAEEMNEELTALKNQAISAACASFIGNTQTRQLNTKGVNYGSISATRALFGGTNCPSPFPTRRFTLNTNNVVGVNTDLVVRPFQWKGVVNTVRDFNRGASHNELGMQAVEITGDNVDGDGDGVKDEMSVADQTAMAVYIAGQPRPVTKIELSALRDQLIAGYGAAGEAEADLLGLPALSGADITAINHGGTLFASIGCATCHKPQLLINDPVFNEPSANASYRDATFPAGQNPVARGLNPADPVAFDLTVDPPDNVITAPGDPNTVVAHLGPLEVDGNGKAIVAIFADLKRHNMDGLQENVDEQGFGAGVWITAELWGAGSTAPYLHDGRATTISEAVIEHKGEGQTSNNAFQALSAADRSDVVAFIENLVLFKPE